MGSEVAHDAVSLETLTDAELSLMQAYWQACNYLSVGMIYLKDNPLLREPLKADDVKHRLLGHWGASPALSFVWVHLNRLIVRDDLDIGFVAGPGHGAPGVLGPTYLEGTYSEVYPDKTQDAEGMQKFFKQFSFPGHIGSHVTPETPGSIHEGGELGYSLSHAYGMALDNPDLIVACVVGDGKAETGPLATAWHSNCAKGIGIWPRASTDAGEEPDVVLASCGDVATMEALAAAAILRERIPDLKLRFVNVVDLFKLQPASVHPHGSIEWEFDSLFTTDKPIIFNFHGYPWLIHRLAYRFKAHEHLHACGYREKGNINTPLELAMLNETSRFHLVIDVIKRVPKLRTKAAHLSEDMKNAIIDNLRYAHEHGTDRPELANWTWPY